ncbi:MAG: alpha/beta hydrolase [Candidatus Bathyarchaeota archaeon]
MPFAKNEDVKIYYSVEGEGYPLMIHHGLSGYPGSWRSAGYLEPLKEKHELILLNARGHGKSSKPHRPEDYSMKKMVGDAVAVLDHLGYEKTHFWGFSLGGRVGLASGKYAPDRFSALIIGGMGVDEWDTEASKNRRKEMIEFFSKGNEAIIREMEEMSGGRLSEQERKYYMKLDTEAVTAIIRLNERLGYEEFIPKVKTPTLLYCGDKDYYFPGAKRCAEIMSNARFVSLPGLDHGEAFDRVDLVLPYVLNFLKNIDKPRTMRS